MRFSYLGHPRRVRGILAEVQLEAWGGSIHPHEKTMPAPVEDRLALLRAVRANLSPIYALYRGPRRELSSWLDDATTSAPYAEVLSSLHDDDLTYGTAAIEDGRLIHRVAEAVGDPPTVCALHESVLEDREGDLRFVPDAVGAEEEVRAGEAVAAFFLPPTKVEQIRAVIDKERRLPQKSTYFWPKPRTGFVIRPLS